MSRRTSKKTLQNEVLFDDTPPPPAPSFIVLPPELKKLLVGGVDRIEGGPATIISRNAPVSSVTIAIDTLEITFNTLQQPHCNEPLTVYGVRCEDLPRMTTATVTRAVGGVVFQSTGWTRFHQAENYDPPPPPTPPTSSWHPIPIINHIRGLLPFAEACHCDSAGAFTAASVYSSATTKLSRDMPSDKFSVIVPARALSAAFRAGRYKTCCVFENRLYLRGDTVTASIGHVENLSAMNASPLIEFCETYPIKTRITFDPEIEEFPFPEPRGAIRFRGCDSLGRMESDYGDIPFQMAGGTPAFDFVIADVEGLRALLLNKSIEVYVPQKANHPVGFRLGGAWFWSISLP